LMSNVTGHDMKHGVSSVSVARDIEVLVLVIPRWLKTS
jgi:hypothetical protein